MESTVLVMKHYDECLVRVEWKPSEKLHPWVSSRIVYVSLFA